MIQELHVLGVTMGEGWHNNHHHYQYPRQVSSGGNDMSYYILKLLSLSESWGLEASPQERLRVLE